MGCREPHNPFTKLSEDLVAVHGVQRNDSRTGTPGRPPSSIAWRHNCGPSLNSGPVPKPRCQMATSSSGSAVRRVGWTVAQLHERTSGCAVILPERSRAASSTRRRRYGQVNITSGYRKRVAGGYRGRARHWPGALERENDRTLQPPQ